MVEVLGYCIMYIVPVDFQFLLKFLYIFLRKYCSTPKEHVGPLQQPLESYGNLICCLVPGQYGKYPNTSNLLPQKQTTSPTKKVGQSLMQSVGYCFINYAGDY